jgi:hypothetical protein
LGFKLIYILKGRENKNAKWMGGSIQ